MDDDGISTAKMKTTPSSRQGNIFFPHLLSGMRKAFDLFQNRSVIADVLSAL